MMHVCEDYYFDWAIIQSLWLGNDYYIVGPCPTHLDSRFVTQSGPSGVRGRESVVVVREGRGRGRMWALWLLL